MRSLGQKKNGVFSWGVVGTCSFICWCQFMGRARSEDRERGWGNGEKNEGGFWKARDSQAPQGLCSIGSRKLSTVTRVCPLGELIPIT